ncbi:hypothetical protein E2C01_016746 [Portunus trituberculatus]|uniref:Uncharacterized protein n=1 Tax=Portunus trituberculatus TaxID=210409 RepID=A0A5B7DR17_PORTR|nr:hypothetical protein [Portunus trituberculatus]
MPSSSANSSLSSRRPAESSLCRESPSSNRASPNRSWCCGLVWRPGAAAVVVVVVVVVVEVVLVVEGLVCRPVPAVLGLACLLLLLGEACLAVLLLPELELWLWLFVPLPACTRCWELLLLWRVSLRSLSVVPDGAVVVLAGAPQPLPGAGAELPVRCLLQWWWRRWLQRRPSRSLAGRLGETLAVASVEECLVSLSGRSVRRELLSMEPRLPVVPDTRPESTWECGELSAEPRPVEAPLSCPLGDSKVNGENSCLGLGGLGLESEATSLVCALLLGRRSALSLVLPDSRERCLRCIMGVARLSRPELSERCLWLR